MFEAPAFTFWTVLYTAIGAAVFWGKQGRTQLKPFIVSDIVRLLVKNETARHIIEFSIFMVFGCLVGVGVATPTNVRQAVTAGMAWTGFLAAPRSGRQTKEKQQG